MTNMDFRSEDVFFKPIDTKELEGSMLLLARKKIILPERKIIVERPMGISLSKYPPDGDGKFGRTSTGIILSR